MLAAQHLVALHAPLVGGRYGCAAGDDVIAANVAAGSGGEAAIGEHALSEVRYGGRSSRKACRGNQVSGKSIA